MEHIQLLLVQLSVSLGHIHYSWSTFSYQWHIFTVPQPTTLGVTPYFVRNNIILYCTQLLVYMWKICTSTCYSDQHRHAFSCLPVSSALPSTANTLHSLVCTQPKTVAHFCKSHGMHSQLATLQWSTWRTAPLHGECPSEQPEVHSAGGWTEGRTHSHGTHTYIHIMCTCIVYNTPSKMSACLVYTYLPFCLGLKDAYGRRESCSKGMSSAAMSISSYSTLAGKSE